MKTLIAIAVITTTLSGFGTEITLSGKIQRKRGTKHMVANI